jgi:hypothetical protein
MDAGADRGEAEQPHEPDADLRGTPYHARALETSTFDMFQETSFTP